MAAQTFVDGEIMKDRSTQLITIVVANGFLSISAKKEGKIYTSTRISTKGKKEFQYGKIEIRAKLPLGKGLWPAFWMLGSNIDSVGWPKSGEIDILEYVGKEPE